MKYQDNAASKLDPKELLVRFEEMRKQAARDSLTGLLNRGALEREVESRLQKREPGSACALFMVDLDNFKGVNDTLGHQAGDQLLVQTARLLSGMFRATDIVARLGGDEFVVFLSGRITEEMVRGKAQRICDQVQFLMGDSPQLMVTASVGVRFSRAGRADFDRLYRAADVALYQVKESGKQGYCLLGDTDELTPMAAPAAKPVNAVRLRSLLDSIDSGIAMIDTHPPMRFVYVSNTFARMLGQPVEQVMGRMALDPLHPEDREAVGRILSQQVVEHDAQISRVVRVQPKSGEMVWWRIHAVRVEEEEGHPVALITATDVSDLKEKETDLTQDKELFKLVLEQSPQGVWELDLITGKFRIITGGERFSFSPGEVVEFPQGLLDRHWLAPKCRESFREFAQEMTGGKGEGHGNFKVSTDQPGEYAWVAISYRTVFDDEQKPVRVVGLIEQFSNLTLEQEHHPKGAQLPDKLLAGMELQISGSLTRDMIHSLWVAGQDQSGQSYRYRLSDLLEQEAGRVLPTRRGVSHSRVFSREALLRIYQERGNQWLPMEYRRKDQKGGIQWAYCLVNLYPNPKGGEVMLALWVSSLENRKNWEARYGLTCYRDPVSKLYTRSTVREMAGCLLEQHQHTLCCLAVIEVGGLAQIFAQDSGRIDSKWKAVANALSLAMGTNCVPGQLGADRFVIFYPQIPSQEAVKRRLEQAFIFVRDITSDLVDSNLIRLVAGVACAYQDEAQYDMLLHKAQKLCANWENGSGDHIAFTEGDPEEGWKKLSRPQPEDTIRLPDEDISRPLSDREQSTALSCFLWMFNAVSLEEETRHVLRSLGEFYEADRVYILNLAEQGTVINMSHEWTNSQKRSIQQAVSGSPASSFPLIQRCAKENRPIFLTRKTSDEREDSSGREQLWHFAVFPMRDEEGVQGYLCVENARNHMGDATLPLLLSSCILKERRKYLYQRREHLPEHRSEEAGLSNHGAYLEVIYSFNSDSYPSLGVVCVDVPGFAGVNSTQGFEYGRKMMWYLVQTITEIFGRAMTFRTWDAEFVALCPNTTQDVFYGRCARLRAKLTRRYPREIRVGSAWSDKTFTGKSLVEEAKVAMQQDRRCPPCPNCPPPSVSTPPFGKCWQRAASWSISSPGST